PGGGLPWWRDGLRFECTQCGNCCSGPPGAVWFTREEGEAMAAALGLALPDFLRLHARTIDGRWSLTEVAGLRGMDCVLLDRESQPGKALCRVYQSRPAQCRTWPFWQRNLVSRDAWRRAAESTPCPGMNGGTFFPAESIVKRLLSERTSEEGSRW
ncbi:MAG: YkgJ family cysteine cluster protein, partial [Planctomycetota bacterium]